MSIFCLFFLLYHSFWYADILILELSCFINASFNHQFFVPLHGKVCNECVLVQLKSDLKRQFLLELFVMGKLKDVFDVIIRGSGTVKCLFTLCIFFSVGYVEESLW